MPKNTKYSKINLNEIWSDYYPNTLIPIQDFITADIFGADSEDLQEAFITALTTYFEGKKIITATVYSDTASMS